MEEIKHKIDAGEFLSALNELMSLVNDDNYDDLPEILEGIFEIQGEGFLLNQEQLQKIKPYIDDFDEDIQNYATNIFLKNINKGITSTKEDLSFLILKLSSLDASVRENIIDFLIKIHYNLEEDETKRIVIDGLIENLDDELWNIRIKIIRFLDEILTDRSDLIKKFEGQLEILYNEKDIDVKKEALDFLLRVFIETYTKDDIKEIINSIPYDDWDIQEKKIFIIGKLGINRENLIRPVVKDFIYLLDNKNYLVTKAIKDAITEMMDYHVQLFDDSFLEIIKNNEIDHIESIEELIKLSIVRNGFERFYQIFKKIPHNSLRLVKPLNTIIKKLNSSEPDFLDSLMYQLTIEVLKDLTKENYSKLKLILQANMHYHLYSNCYKALNEIDISHGKEAEMKRRELSRFLVERMPDLNFLNVQKSIEFKLMEGPVHLGEIAEEFEVNKSKLKNFINDLIEKEELDALLSNDTLALKASTTTEEEDFLFFKKWNINKKPRDPKNYEVRLFILIRNVSEVDVNNLSVNLEYPVKLYDIKLDSQIPNSLEPNQELILTYVFQKNKKREQFPKTSNIKVIFNYKKNGKSCTIEKKLDVLFL